MKRNPYDYCLCLFSFPFTLTHQKWRFLVQYIPLQCSTVPILLFKFKLEMGTSLQCTVKVVVHGTRLSDLEETDQWVFRPKIGLDLKIGQAGL